MYPLGHIFFILIPDSHIQTFVDCSPTIPCLVSDTHSLCNPEPPAPGAPPQPYHPPDLRPHWGNPSFVLAW